MGLSWIPVTWHKTGAMSSGASSSSLGSYGNRSFKRRGWPSGGNPEKTFRLFKFDAFVRIHAALSYDIVWQSKLPWWIHNGFRCKKPCSSSGSLTMNESFHVAVNLVSMHGAHLGPLLFPLAAARAAPHFVYSCVYFPILILAITRMAGRVKGRFAHSQWMGQYWQHAHCISDQCWGLARTRFARFVDEFDEDGGVSENKSHRESMQMLNVALTLSGVIMQHGGGWLICCPCPDVKSAFLSGRFLIKILI